MKIDLLSIPLVNSYSVSDTDLQRADFPPLGCHDVDAGDVMWDLVVEPCVPRDKRPPAWRVGGGVGCSVLDPPLGLLSGVSPLQLLLILISSDPARHVSRFGEVIDTFSEHEVEILSPAREIQSAASTEEVFDRACSVLEDDSVHLCHDGLDLVLQSLCAVNPT